MSGRPDLYEHNVYVRLARAICTPHITMYCRKNSCWYELASFLLPSVLIILVC